MDYLPDDVLQKVFSYFTVKQRLKYERVCKRWRMNMPYGMTEIDLVDTLMPEDKERRRLADTFPLMASLYSLLSRCGHRLQKVSFGHSNLLITTCALRRVVDFCPRLQHLDLSFCVVTDQAVQVLQEIAPNLRSLNFANATFSVMDTRNHVENMRILFSTADRLESIDLERSNVNNLLAVQCLPDMLRRLNLNGCSPLEPSALFELIVKCYDLEELRISAYSSVNALIVEAVCSLPRLRVLDISRQSFGQMVRGVDERDAEDYADWRKLRQLTTLEELHCQYNNDITEYVMESVFEHCTRLRVLDVSYCRRLSTFSTWLRKAHSRLTDVRAGSSDVFTDEDAEMLAACNGATLRVFHASECTLIGSAAMNALAAYCPRLRSLHAAQCDRLTPEDVERVLDACTDLQTVDLRGVHVADTVFENIMLANRERAPAKKALRFLRHLDLSYCSELTDTGLSCINSICIGNEEISQCHPEVYVHQTRVTRAFARTLEPMRLRLYF